MNYFLLGLAIVAEVVGTSFMKQSEGFTKLVPSLITITAYVIAFYCLSLTLKTFRRASPMRSGRALGSC